ncbi:MAG TPA: RDD family protein [Acidothermaceae bacterium]|nr:RDD family protein [Acidothermaceae bacterium]
MTAGVVTGEAVSLEIRLAHWPSRLVAFVIDLIAEFAAWVVITLLLARILEGADSDLAAAVVVVASVFVFLGYPITFETLWRGRTLGKAALGIRVVRDDGAPERFRHAFVRAVLMPLEFWGPALLSSIVNRRAKRLGDLLAGTVVVQERVPSRTVAPVSMPPPLIEWARLLDLSRFPDDLALSVRQFLARQHELRPEARTAMGNQLVAAVRSAVTPDPPPGTPGWAYLSAVLAERRRREEERLRTTHAPPPLTPPPFAPAPAAPAPPPAPPSDPPSSGPFAPPA